MTSTGERDAPMARRHFLKRRRDRRGSGPPTVTTLLALLGEHVIDRFARVGLTEVQAVALGVSEPNEEEPAPNPSHPACAEFAASDYCRESWQLHLAKLKRHAETHWGTCQHERLCAMIPVVCAHRCLAVVKLAGPASLNKSEFRRLMEILELLVRDFAASHADFLRRVPGGVAQIEALPAPPGANEGRAVGPSPTHPQVVRALEYIAAHLSDPRLRVGHMASVLDVCPSYLSELFVAHVGQRLSRFIATRRIELAKNLLATTDRQIKRIALETGHANPNWFSHVFSVHTGLTPGEYRAAARTKPWPPPGAGR